MKFLESKKAVEIFFLALGFFLLIISVTLINKPYVNQGVQTVNASTFQQK